MEDFGMYIIEVISWFIPRFYLKIKQKRLHIIAKIVWYVLVWGIGLGIFVGGVFILATLYNLILS